VGRVPGEPHLYFLITFSSLCLPSSSPSFSLLHLSILTSSPPSSRPPSLLPRSLTDAFIVHLSVRVGAQPPAKRQVRDEETRQEESPQKQSKGGRIQAEAHSLLFDRALSTRSLHCYLKELVHTPIGTDLFIFFPHSSLATPSLTAPPKRHEHSPSLPPFLPPSLFLSFFPSLPPSRSPSLPNRLTVPSSPPETNCAGLPPSLSIHRVRTLPSCPRSSAASSNGAVLAMCIGIGGLKGMKTM